MSQKFYGEDSVKINNAIKGVLEKDSTASRRFLADAAGAAVGVEIKDPAVFNTRITLIRKGLGLSANHAGKGVKSENRKKEIKEFLLGKKATPISDEAPPVAGQVVEAIKALKGAMRRHGVAEVTVTPDGKTAVKLTREVMLDC
jgi:hypothetical protein